MCRCGSIPCAIMRGREPAGSVQHARALLHTTSKMISTNCPIVAITEVCYFWWFRVESAVGGTCYGVRATLLVGLEKALYTGSTWGQAVGAGGQLDIVFLGPAGRRNVRCCVLSDYACL